MHEDLEPSLYDRLKSFGDPFVNSCLMENHNVTSWFMENEFQSATHIERLALMRNLEMSHNERLLKKLFAHDDTELSLTTKEREELILAFLSNQAAIVVLEKNADLTDAPKPAYRSSYERSAFNDADSLLTALWQLASQWPMDKLPAPVPELTFRHLPANDNTKAEVYQHCKAARLRNAILESTTKGDLKTLGLGAADDDEGCSQTARWMIDRYHLHDQIDAYPERNAEHRKSLKDRLRDWRRQNEAIWLAGNFFFWITLAGYGLFYTDKGYEVASKLVDFYSTWPGMIGFWVLVIMLALFAIGILEELCARYRWIYHVFWLGLIVGLYFIKEDKLMAGIIAAFYFGSLFLPKVWQELSNDLTNKIVDKVNVTLANKSL